MESESHIYIHICATYPSLNFKVICKKKEKKCNRTGKAICASTFGSSDYTSRNLSTKNNIEKLFFNVSIDLNIYTPV